MVFCKEEIFSPSPAASLVSTCSVSCFRASSHDASRCASRGRGGRWSGREHPPKQISFKCKKVPPQSGNIVWPHLVRQTPPMHGIDPPEGHIIQSLPHAHHPVCP